MQQERRIPQQLHQPEQKPPDAADIASRVSGAVDNLKRDSQTVQNPYELRRRADMAMVAMLEVVAPVLPEIVQEQVQRLISIHNALYQTAKPSAPQHKQEHEQGTSPRTRSPIR